MLCNKSFFGSKSMPVIDVSEESLQKLANQSTAMGLTVPGVQRKLSLHLSNEATPRLTLVGFPAGYILKPASAEYPCLPESEDMAMDIASAFGVKTVEHGLIKAGDTMAYITKRVDRLENRKLAMEDFCQLGERLSVDKYKSSYEKCAEIIRYYSSRPGLDMTEFYLRLVVSFITGNSDMHLKNFSLIESAPGSREFFLSPAYDFLPVNLILPDDKEEMALTLCGKKSRLKRENFIAFAKHCEIPEPVAGRLIDSCGKKFSKALRICDDSYLPDEMKAAFKVIMQDRMSRLGVALD